MIFGKKEGKIKQSKGFFRLIGVFKGTVSLI